MADTGRVKMPMTWPGYAPTSAADVQVDDDALEPAEIWTPPGRVVQMDLQARIGRGEKLKLNMGAGEQRYRGYIGIDIVPGPACDLVHDLEEPLAFLPDGCCSHIFCSHTLEHLHMHRVPLVLKEWHRLLCDKGILWGYVPDGLAAAQIYIKADETDDHWAHRKATEMLLGASSYDYTRGDEQTHHCAFTVRTLSGVLNAGGFQAVQVDREQAGPWDYRLAFYAIKGIYTEQDLHEPVWEGVQ